MVVFEIVRLCMLGCMVVVCVYGLILMMCVKCVSDSMMLSVIGSVLFDRFVLVLCGMIGIFMWW